MNSNLVSIIMPSYNTAQYIGDSIKSVLAQTYVNWELIIVDDCSTDDTVDILKKFSDSRIRIFRNKVNSGAAQTRNRAIREAKGRWLAFLDSDDLWYPKKLEKQISFMEKNGYSFSYTRYEQIDESGNFLGLEINGPIVVDSEKIKLCNWLGCLTVMYDTKLIGKMYSPNIRSRNDYSMWLQIAKKKHCYLLDENLAKYRKHKSGSISSSGIMELVKAHYNLYRGGFGLNIVESCLRTMVNIVCVVYKKVVYVRQVA